METFVKFSTEYGAWFTLKLCSLVSSITKTYFLKNTVILNINKHKINVLVTANFSLF